MDGVDQDSGAYNKIRQLLDRREVCRLGAASAGNQAQGVGLAPTKPGVESTIVVPRIAPQTVVNATRGYGASVDPVGQDFQVSLAHAREWPTGTRRRVHPPLRRSGHRRRVRGPSAWRCTRLSPRWGPCWVPSAATVPESLDKGLPQTCWSADTIADGIPSRGISGLTLSMIEARIGFHQPHRWT